MKPPPSTHRYARLVGCVLWGTLWLLAACGDLVWDAAEAEATADLSGEWSLRGNGSRWGCSDPVYDGTFRVRLIQPVPVIQTDTLDCHLDRIMLGEEVQFNGARISLTGGVQGHRVDFTLREERAGSSTTEFRFRGIWYPVSATIEGDFEGDGPFGCHSSGNFTVDVDRGWPTVRDE